MAVALLLLAALVLVVAMLVLTLGVNELEKKGAELAGLVRKRYAIADPRKAKGLRQGKAQA
jgi:hypothetical protein